MRREQTDRKHWQLLYTRLKRDIKDKTPQLIRQRQEYDAAVDQIAEYQQRLESALAERDDAEATARACRNELSVFQRRLQERQAESHQLAHKVQALLVKQSGGSSTSYSNDKADDASAVVPTSIQEMQSQNQRLLVEHRRLTQTIEEMEEKYQSDALQTKLEQLQNDLEVLQEQQQQQESYVKQIVQQRDLYRVLLNNHDSRALGASVELGGTAERTAFDMVKQNLDRAKALHEDNVKLEGDIQKLRAEHSCAIADKEAASERLARYETHNTDLTQSIDRVERDLRSAHSQIARCEAQAKHHEEKCERVEASLERVRGELVHVHNANNELQRINADLQESVSKASSERAQLSSDAQQAERKLRLTETQLSTAKAAEQRALTEVAQLKADLTRQGALIESVRRIETSLGVKAQGK